MAVPGFLVLIGIEVVAARLLRRRVYRLEDSITDLSCGLGDQVIAALTGGLLALPYLWLQHKAPLFDLDPKAASTWVIAMLGKDLGYYFFHRFSHRAAVGWAAHSVHHQSEDYNLAVALRQSWFAGLYSWVFYLPLAWLGVPFEVYAAASAINLLYQFWIHTRLIDRLGPLEWVLNTPSHHRVHHGCQPAYIDKNYAGIFIVWDRLFGTFAPEREAPTYGVIHPIRTWSATAANVRPYAELLAASWNTPGLWNKVQLWFRPPGWTPQTGEPPHPLPGPGRGYEPTVSRRLRIYLVGMFVPTIAAIVTLMAAAPHPWSAQQMAWYGLLAVFVLSSATVFGGLMDGRSWAKKAEVVRVLLFLMAFAGVGLWRGAQRTVLDTVDPEALRSALPSEALPLSVADTDIILAIGCTFRRDRLGVYGGSNTTPFLDALAGAGVTFERNYSQAPWTRPSTGTLITGRWARPLHLDNPGKKGALSLVLDPGFDTLAEVLQARGYRTVGAVANPNARSIFGFSQGFDVYHEPSGSFHGEVQLPGGDELVDRVLAELAATPADQRFFGELLFTTTHEPRTPPFQYQKWFLHLPSALANYDAALRQLDGQLARLFVGARERRRNLLFIVAADHGEGLREPQHHGRGHGRHLYPSAIQVPLIYQHPSLSGGRRIGGLSMNIDVVPTLRDLLGLEPDPSLDGKSEASALRGDRSDAVHEAVFAETFFMRTRKSTVIERDWQLVHDLKRARWSLYSTADPRAERDLGQEQPAVLRRLTAQLSAWEAEMGRIAAAHPERTAEPDAETTAMLEALGYRDEAGDDE